MIRALPAILARHKNVIYIISGATHPHIKRHEGERYRERLQTLAAKCGVSSHVIFNDRFMSAEELIEHLSAADIYITPYHHEASVVSGTLAIAAGAGKAIISTPYWHAKELIADGRGVVVPFDHPNSIADAATGSWTTMPSGMRCESAPVFTRGERRGKARPRLIWRVFNAHKRNGCRGHAPPRRIFSQ